MQRFLESIRHDIREWRRPLPPRLEIGLLIAAGALLTIGFLIERVFRPSLHRDQLGGVLVAWDSITWFVWLFAAPAILSLARRFPVAPGERRRNAPKLVLGAVAIYVAVVNLRFVIRITPNLWLPAAQDVVVDLRTFWGTMLVSLPMDFLTFGGFFAAATAINHHLQHRQRAEEMLQLRLRTAQLESELAQAELNTLRDQLHPHFLFNSFNAVSTLVRQGRNTAAVEMIARLSTLLRYAIERTGRPTLRLEQEMDFIRRYLEIESIRFGDKLRVTYDLDAAALRAAVPNLVLQPLVENAIKHGISRRTAPGALEIRGRVADDRIQVTIENDGPEPGVTIRPPSCGIGLSNTRRRLSRVYGGAFRLDLKPREDGGMCVELEMPYQPLPDESP